jgi:hypothetical protein
VRSYSFQQIVSLPSFEVSSLAGRLNLRTYTTSYSSPLWEVNSYEVTNALEWQQFVERDAQKMLSGPSPKIKSFHSFPHSPFVVGVAALALAPWLRCRFSLRTLLIATTLVAVVLGLIVAMVRWQAG